MQLYAHCVLHRSARVTFCTPMLLTEFEHVQVAIKRACSHPQAKQAVLAEFADKVMEALLKLQASRQAVNDEVVMTMSVLCQEQGTAFHRYLPHVMPTMMAGVARHEDLQVCRVCINALGDIAREVTEHLQPYADQCVPHLIGHLLA